MNVSTYAKAIAGALIAALSVLATALADGSVTSGEWIKTAIAFIVGLAAVYVVPNAAKNQPL